MDIAVVGTGYVGLVAGTCFAESGNNVICVDINQAKIDALNQGVIPIYEPGLEELVKRNTREGRLKFTTNLQEAVEFALIHFIAVGTPPGVDGSADLQYVLGVAQDIGKHLNSYKVVVNKSTVPVGTAQKVKDAIQDELNKRDAAYEFDVVSNPEFLKEGAAIDDFMKPDRVVIGTDNVRTAELMKELYSPFVRTGKPILVMDNASAEMTKYASNALLATKISFMNEMANLCDRVEADIENVRIGVGADSRIGYPFLFPGAGYGGSCFPKDVQALLRMGHATDYQPEILQAVENTNQRQKRVLIEKVFQHFNQDVQGKRFAIWGLSFKPKTDDMREAPSVVIIEALLEKGAEIWAYDPVAMNMARQLFGDRVNFVDHNYDALSNVDGLIVVTEWDEFRRPDFPKMKDVMRTPVIFDGRNIYTPERLRQLGFVYYGIGRR